MFKPVNLMFYLFNQSYCCNIFINILTTIKTYLDLCRWEHIFVQQKISDVALLVDSRSCQPSRPQALHRQQRNRIRNGIRCGFHSVGCAAIDRGCCFLLIEPSFFSPPNSWSRQRSLPQQLKVTIEPAGSSVDQLTFWRIWSQII